MRGPIGAGSRRLLCAPLVALQSPEWDEKLKPYLDRIRIAERKAGLEKKPLRRGAGKRGPGSEIDRILAWSRQQQEQGRPRGGRTHSLRSCRPFGRTIPNTKARPQARAKVSRGAPRPKHRGQPADSSFVEAALDRADGLAKDGKHDEAGESGKESSTSTPRIRKRRLSSSGRNANCGLHRGRANFHWEG
jgi:hypothetical protein